jgi:hypothetical protein
MLGLPDVAIGAITASVIAGIISLLGLIISKEQKTSDFRQAWIDELRKEISNLISHANAIHGFSLTSPKAIAEQWKEVRDDFVGINRATAMVRLRLNPKEKPSIEILKTIEEIEKLLTPGNSPDYRVLNDIEKKLVRQTSTVLKMEWNRVRHGEMAYRVAKYVALVFIAVVLLAGSMAVYKAVVLPEQPIAGPKKAG